MQILEIFFTPRCPICGVFQDSNNFCYECFSSVEFLNGGCLKCAEPFEYPVPGVEICQKCAELNLGFEYEMRAAIVYNSTAKNLILRLKNHQDFGLVQLFSHVLRPILADFKGVSDVVIVPVPLYKKRLVWRGYNQTSLLANVVARELGVQVVHALKRVKNTNSQAMKTTQERIENVAGAFEIDKKFARFLTNKHVLVLDDVITTGATALECAKTLQNGGVYEGFGNNIGEIGGKGSEGLGKISEGVSKDSGRESKIGQNCGPRMVTIVGIARRLRHFR